MPRYFPAASEIEPLLPRFKRYTRAEILILREAGLVECVNTDRKLWKWTHRANVQTVDAAMVKGGRLSTRIPQSIFNNMADLMAQHA